ncbi:PEP-CTERM sorting domain-containing protein [Nodularia spumigena]|uniref:PEP-CTERM sorting domain-containing protein n=2 Tax=Nodularia spumigena TaxID=70799 RepID=UPI00232DBB47|nr:PEP-CTERM sorting domain-containing protein [Nodularia spumigena]MDB9305932.1 PEP-CTERM sorting domain-containing protein [Nodularia spumigena CS-591/12]MDB9319897.1 PEP-CTERM sorting domain-containing protein [Nodularia spumigena CS-590/01A]MDB9320631.1 PEP-CTERM sorting domain-containing protein [Nodularia spumigena CS-591/07A]MDB9330150.1 PEP-CTERM sorting domain-containing protein [Nodularia spumigena CS-591/04]MDB9336339.1 PEP-CTERM sorting domain-containing protein [Nodularia spumigen
MTLLEFVLFWLVIYMQKLALTAGISLFFGLLMSEPVQAANFSITPTVTFEVVDGGFLGTFDGLGDEIFPNNFDSVVLGFEGEAAEFAEFDLTQFSIPPLESITSVIFQAQISTTQVFGLGSPGGVPPNNLGVFGYVGNGEPNASDLQAGTLLTTVDTSTATGGEILRFDVTSFVQKRINNGDRFVGLAVRAQDPGGVVLGGANFGGIPPTLIISTVPESSTTLGLLAFGALGVVAMRKRSVRV